MKGKFQGIHSVPDLAYVQERTLLFQNIMIGLLLLLLAWPTSVRGQSAYSDYYGESLRINNIGMAVLGGWALTNISIGAYGWSHNSGQRSYFHQMNLFWNTVNLSIAGFALYSNLTSEYAQLTGPELMDKQLKFQRLYLINAGLDVAYLAGGGFLHYLAPKYPNNESRLRGYGNSVILQGTFLLVFDLIMFGLQSSHRTDFLQQITLVPMHDAWGIAITLHM